MSAPVETQALRYRYPSPFFDIGDTYMPKSITDMFRWCKYYFMVNPIINAAIYKKAVYPITPIQFLSNDEAVETKYRHLFDDVLNIRQVEIETGLNYQTFGIAMVSLRFPFVKYLQCERCKEYAPAYTWRKHYKMRGFDFFLRCPKCGRDGKAKVWDFPVPAVDGVRVVQWNPEHIRIQHVEGENYYIYDIPKTIKNDMIAGKPRIVERLPQVYFEAAKKNRGLLLDTNSIFVMRRASASLSPADQGWGLPMLYPVLKDAYYMQILKKSQEMVANEHIMPMRVLFPQGGSGTSDPYSTVNLADWKSVVENEIARWRRDPNYIPVMPIPIGEQSLGGHGRALLLHNEIEQWSRHLAAGLQVPYEFIFGGLSYSGSNVSLRMLENEFLGYRNDMIRMLNFMIRQVARHMRWPVIRATMANFKMADDLQRNAFMLQLNQSNKISDRRLADEVGYDHLLEHERMRSEATRKIERDTKMQVAMAAAQAKAMPIQARYQALANQIMQIPPAGPSPSLSGMQQPQLPMQSGQPQMEQGPPSQGPEPAQEEQPAPPAGGIPPEMQSDVNMHRVMEYGGRQWNILDLAKMIALKIMQSEPEQGQIILDQLPDELKQLVIQIIMARQGGQEHPDSPVQMPLPTQRPPRRTPEKALI